MEFVAALWFLCEKLATPVRFVARCFSQTCRFVGNRMRRSAVVISGGAAPSVPRPWRPQRPSSTPEHYARARNDLALKRNGRTGSEMWSSALWQAVSRPNAA